MAFEVRMFLYFIFMLILMISCSSEALKFNVGGKYGWSLEPSHDYNPWAERNRFQVNDSLIFKYKKGTDSVLQVNQNDYNSCNKTSPIRTLDNQDGYSEFKFDHWGLFYFISGQADHCQKGQRLIVLVIAPRNYTRPVSSYPAPATSPAASPAPVISPAASPEPVTSTAASPVPATSPALAPAAGELGGPAPAPAEGASSAAGFGGGSSMKLLFCILSVSVGFVVSGSF